MQKIKAGGWRIVALILKPIAYLVVIMLAEIDRAAHWLDKRFDTKLRRWKITVDEVKVLIEANLPIGSRSENVFAFLKEWRFSYWEEFNDYSSEYEYMKNVNREELPRRREIIKKYTGAWMRNVGKDLLFRWDIRIIFYFDEGNSLVEYEVESFGTGL